MHNIIESDADERNINETDLHTFNPAAIGRVYARPVTTPRSWQQGDGGESAIAPGASSADKLDTTIQVAS